MFDNSSLASNSKKKLINGFNGYSKIAILFLVLGIGISGYFCHRITQERKMIETFAYFGEEMSVDGVANANDPYAEKARQAIGEYKKAREKAMLSVDKKLERALDLSVKANKMVMEACNEIKGAKRSNLNNNK